MQVYDFCSGGILGYNVSVMWHTENLGFIYKYKGKSMADWGQMSLRYWCYSASAWIGFDVFWKGDNL